MEPLMYSALLKFISTGNFGETGINGGELEKWRKRAKLFTVQNESVLLWQGMTVPTMTQVERILYPVHYLNEKNHCKDKRILRKALLDEGCALPPFMGGLERACAL